MDEELLTKLVKGKLNITWSDEDTDTKVTTIIEDAIPTLDHKLGGKGDYCSPGQERSLFLNYCLYAWNDCINEFDINYKHEIYQVRFKNEVKANKVVIDNGENQQL